MDKIKEYKYYIDSLCIYDLKDDEVISSIYRLITSVDTEDVLAAQSQFFKLVTKHGSLKKYISECILTDDNIFAKAACTGDEDLLSPAIIKGVKADLKKLEAISSFCVEDVIAYSVDSDIRRVLKTIPAWEVGESVAPLIGKWEDCIDELANYYSENGYGIFSKNVAFSWRDGEVMPITSTDPVRLSDLKNYEDERQKIIENTESFINGHPANNVLLYGDRGTGKSATVHALLNEYSGRGLRMIEVPKSHVADLPVIRERILGSPMKFIIFIDDLSFDSNDDSFSELKAALEGSLSVKQDNMLIYATSNRRHLIRENFSDREDDMHQSDIVQEQLSLADRFGLTITFINPDREDYLDIVMKICRDRQLGYIDEDRLFASAERWAQLRGGRSPRTAKQFVDYVEGCIKQEIDW